MFKYLPGRDVVQLSHSHKMNQFRIDKCMQRFPESYGSLVMKAITNQRYRFR